MTPFDPYHKWLGIPPDEQPAGPRRLLGISEDENDPQVVRDAALRQTAFVRKLSMGEHGGHAERILGELADARDSILSGKVESPTKPAVKPTPSPVESIAASLVNVAAAADRETPQAETPPREDPLRIKTNERPADSPQPSARSRSRSGKPIWKEPWAISAVAVGIVMILLLVIVFFDSGDTYTKTLSRANEGTISQVELLSRTHQQTNGPQKDTLRSTPLSPGRIRFLLNGFDRNLLRVKIDDRHIMVPPTGEMSASVEQGIHDVYFEKRGFAPDQRRLHVPKNEVATFIPEIQPFVASPTFAEADWIATSTKTTATIKSRQSFSASELDFSKFASSGFILTAIGKGSQIRSSTPYLHVFFPTLDGQVLDLRLYGGRSHMANLYVKSSGKHIGKSTTLFRKSNRVVFKGAWTLRIHVTRSEIRFMVNGMEYLVLQIAKGQSTQIKPDKPEMRERQWFDEEQSKQIQPEITFRSKDTTFRIDHVSIRWRPANLNSPIKWDGNRGGNNHWYELVEHPEAIGWQEAREKAIRRGGHLVTITSEAERQFVGLLLESMLPWASISTVDPAEKTVTQNPMIGCFIAASKIQTPATQNHWQWVTGESYEFSSWAKDKPTLMTENVIGTIDGNAQWHDFGPDAVSHRYIVEYEHETMIQPNK